MNIWSSSYQPYFSSNLHKFLSIKFKSGNFNWNRFRSSTFASDSDPFLHHHLQHFFHHHLAFLHQFTTNNHNLVTSNTKSSSGMRIMKTYFIFLSSWDKEEMEFKVAQSNDNATILQWWRSITMRTSKDILNMIVFTKVGSFDVG